MDSFLYTLAPGKQFLKVRGLPSGEALRQNTSMADASEEASPQSLHIIAVIDTSGSMSIEDRLTNVKRSLHFMFSMLSSADKVSLVTFDDHAQVHVKAQPMTLDGMHHVQQVLAKVNMGGSTNLSAGITAAEECLAGIQATKTGLLILTDGQVNRGIKDAPTLVNMVGRLRAAHPTLTVYTTGYGIDHNAALLSAMATEGTGAYSIVHNQEHVASVFGDMLGGLMTCVAQNVEIIVRGEATTRFRVIVSPGGLKRVQMGDIYADAEQVLLLENATRVEVSYLTADGMRHETVLVPEEATAAVQQEARQTGLRLRAAEALERGRSYGLPALEALIAEVVAEAEQPAWADFVLVELRTLILPPLPAALHPALFHTVSGIQQAAVLSLGRGLMATTSCASTVEDDDRWRSTDDDPLNRGFIGGDPTGFPLFAAAMSPPLYVTNSARQSECQLEPALSQCFSSPTQRQVTERLRQISAPHTG